MTRNVPVEVFAEELERTHLSHIIRRKLEDELAALQLYPEVEPTLRSLRATGKRIAVCSNLAYEYGPAVHRLLPDLDAHVLSFEVGAAKPEPAIYEAVCSALATRPCDVLFVGDSKRCDFDGPQAFGMQACWLDRRGGQTLLDALAGVI
jgi:HAD superfamily hydrolase (TIGR01509 family)